MAATAGLALLDQGVDDPAEPDRHDQRRRNQPLEDRVASSLPPQLELVQSSSAHLMGEPRVRDDRTRPRRRGPTPGRLVLGRQLRQGPDGRKDICPQGRWRGRLVQEGELRRGLAELSDLLLAELAAVQMSLELRQFGRVEGGQRVRHRVLMPLAHAAPPNASPSRFMASRIRALTVPSGTFSRVAIWLWVSSS